MMIMMNAGSLNFKGLTLKAREDQGAGSLNFKGLTLKAHLCNSPGFLVSGATASSLPSDSPCGIHLRSNTSVSSLHGDQVYTIHRNYGTYVSCDGFLSVHFSCGNTGLFHTIQVRKY